MAKKILGITRIILIITALLSIVFHIRFVLELGLDIKYGVYWISPESFDSYYLYVNLHLLFLLILIVYLIFECKRGICKNDDNSCHNDSDSAKEYK